MENFYFDTNGFVDPQEKLEGNCNGIGSYDLASTLQSALIAKGFSCGDVFDEDYGWTFDARYKAQEYFCSISVDPNEEGAESGLKFFANINVERRRSLLDKLRWRNKLLPNDIALLTVRQTLEDHPDVNDLKSSLD